MVGAVTGRIRSSRIVNTTTKYRPAADVPKSFQRSSPPTSSAGTIAWGRSTAFSTSRVDSMPGNMAGIVQIPNRGLLRHPAQPWYIQFLYIQQGSSFRALYKKLVTADSA